MRRIGFFSLLTSQTASTASRPNFEYASRVNRGGPSRNWLMAGADNRQVVRSFAMLSLRGLGPPRPEGPSVVDFLSMIAGILSVLSSSLSLAAEVRRSRSTHEDEPDQDRGQDGPPENGGADSAQP